MIYSQFIEKTKDYLKSVRILKDYVSFDLIFKDTWVVTEGIKKDVQIIKEGVTNDNYVVMSFVSKITEEEIDKLEEVVDSIIRFNVEREEKEKLFKTKVNELKSIFANKKLEDLKKLKFETLNDIETYFENDGQENTNGNSELRERKEEEPTEHGD